MGDYILLVGPSGCGKSSMTEQLASPSDVKVREYIRDRPLPLNPAGRVFVESNIQLPPAEEKRFSLVYAWTETQFAVISKNKPEDQERWKAFWSSGEIN